MPNKNSKQTVQKTETPVVKTEVVTPKVEASPAVPQQKGGKKAAAKVAEPVASTPVAATPVAAKVAEPVVAQKQKGGKKGVEPVAAQAPVEVTAPKQKGGKKVVEPVAAAPVEVAATKQKGGKKAAAPKAESTTNQKGGKKAAPKKEKVAELADGEEADDVDGRRIRSFKVKLPNKEEFEGRFTGLTPYQAANKALSKYFRETETPMVEVTFSICESTRKSKKSVYTYVGKRLKLEVPVTYQIQDGRQIVKNFKNSLKKVKKSESAAESA
jgi:hypothetical protein